MNGKGICPVKSLITAIGTLAQVTTKDFIVTVDKDNTCAKSKCEFWVKSEEDIGNSDNIKVKDTSHCGLIRS